MLVGRAGTGGVDVFADEERVEMARGLEMALMDVPRGVTRCLLEEGLRAGESGKNLGLDVLMNVWRSVPESTRRVDTHIWVLVIDTTKRTRKEQ